MVVYKGRDMHCSQLIRGNDCHPTYLWHLHWQEYSFSASSNVVIIYQSRQTFPVCTCSSVRNGLTTVHVASSLLLICGVPSPWHLSITSQVVQGDYIFCHEVVEAHATALNQTGTLLSNHIARG